MKTRKTDPKREKEIGKNLVIVFALLLLAVPLFLVDWQGGITAFAVLQTNSQVDFNQGNYSNTFYNTSGFVQLSAGQTTGNYTSKIFDATADSSWNIFSWSSSAIGELPANSAVETNFASGNANMTGNLLLYHLDESSGAIVDYSGNSNNGTYNGALYGQAGKFNTSIGFDGNDDFINTSLTTDLSGSGAFSVFAWVKNIPTGTNYVVSQAHQMNPSYSSDWILGYSNGGLWFRSQQIDGSNIISDGNWHHLGFTFDGTTARLYIDSNFIGSSTPAGFGAISSVKIMARGDATSSFVSGNIDEIAIWNRTLPIQEIKNNYKRGITKLNLTVRSCDDSSCAGDAWGETYINGTSNSLSVANNRYFQYYADFFTENNIYSPDLYNITVDYSSILSPSCTNGIKDQDETDIDCGGICGATCDDGEVCGDNFDCLNNVCEGGVCVSCSDGVKNYNETDVDCGGLYCGTCDDGDDCVNNTDCSSNFCENNLCVSCNDSIKNHNETDVDCGGIYCTGCTDGLACINNSDCASNSCEANACVSCSDGIQNQGEDYTDCGGPCTACAFIPDLYDDCGNNSAEPHLIQGTDFNWTSGINPNGTGAEKSISYHNDKVIYRYVGLNTSKGYSLRIKYLQPTGGGRVQSLNTSVGQLHGAISVPEYIAQWYNYTVPLAAYINGNLTLYFIKESGLNAVVSELELWQTPDTLPMDSYTWLFDNAVNYVYNSTFVEVVNSSAKFIDHTSVNVWQNFDQTGFGEGSYSNTFYNTSGFVQLSAGQTTGNYASKIFDATADSIWYNISWSSSAIGELPANGAVETNFASSNANMTGNLLLYHLDESSGAIVDYSGNSNNGNNVNGAGYGADGQIDKAVDLTGNGDVIESSSYTFVFADELTLGAWFKYSGAGTGSPRIIEISKDGDADSHCLAPDNDGTLRAWAECNTGTRVATADDSNNYMDGQWHLVVYTYSNPTGTLYVDGSVTDTASGSCANLEDGPYLTVGAISNASGSYSYTQHEFDGYVDEVFVFNRTLSNSEILDIYKRGITKLNLTVRSCDDSSCAGDAWNETYQNSPVNLSVAENPYLQYKFDFYTGNQKYVPRLDEASVYYSLNYQQDGIIQTNDFTASNLAKWVNLTANDSSNVNYGYSTDSGASWSAVPAGGDLSNADVSNKKIRFRGNLTNSSTVIYDLNVYYLTEVTDENCSDGIKNQDETDIDCGGSCSGCANGKACLINSDCSSGLCSGGICQSSGDGGDGGGPGGGSGSGRGTGGGAATSDYNILIGESDSFGLARYQKIQFDIKNATHFIQVMAIGSDFVDLKITSEPIYLTLSLADRQYVDVNGDGHDDINIFVTQIDLNFVNMTVTRLKQPEEQVCDCPSDGNWSECLGNYQIRTVYLCDEQTDYNCVAYNETQFCVLETISPEIQKPVEVKNRILIIILAIVLGSLSFLIARSFFIRKTNKKRRKRRS